MTYRDLIRRVALDSNVSFIEAEKVVSSAIRVIKSKTQDGSSVRLKGLGTIKPHDRGARKRYIPGTGTVRQFKPVRSVKLIPSTDYKKSLNKKDVRP
jgi:nucleoid DNA-binding protein